MNRRADDPKGSGEEIVRMDKAERSQKSAGKRRHDSLGVVIRGASHFCTSEALGIRSRSNDVDIIFLKATD